MYTQNDYYRLTMNSWGKIVKDRKYWENEMEKKFELDSELDLLLDEQLIREAELLEKELFADKNKELYTETEEETQASYERLIARLKADGVYREEETAEEKSVNITEAPKKFNSTQRCLGRGKKISIRRESLTDEQRRRHRRKLSAKIAGVIVVSGMCVFTATMTSEANRKYWLHNMRILTGQDTRVVNGNNETNDRVETDEYVAIAEIEEALGIEVPEFYYRPDKFAFNVYSFDTIVGVARMEYQYKDTIITLHMEKNEEDVITDGSGVLGIEVQKVQMLYDEEEINVYKVYDDNDNLSSCYAAWEKNNVKYSIYGRIELKELCEIVKKIAY